MKLINRITILTNENLHINTGQHGGAALCAIRINRTFSAEDVDSQMLFAEGKNLPNGVEGAIAQKDINPWESNTELRKVKNLLVKLPMRWPMDGMPKSFVID